MTVGRFWPGSGSKGSAPPLRSTTCPDREKVPLHDRDPSPESYGPAAPPDTARGAHRHRPPGRRGLRPRAGPGRSTSTTRSPTRPASPDRTPPPRRAPYVPRIPVHTQEAPKHDGAPGARRGPAPGPGRPNEEHDGRGKDRPVLVVAHEKGPRDAARDQADQRVGTPDAENWVDVGNGALGPRGARVLGRDRPRHRLPPATASGARPARSPREDFDKVVSQLRARYHWS